MENNELIQVLEDNKPTLTQLILVNMPKGSDELDAQRLVMREIANFEMILALRPELQACDKTSVLLAVKQCISDNLTLAPSAGLVYLYNGKVRVGTDGANQAIYKEVLVYDPTSEGEISIARQAGSLLDHKRPVCSYNSEGQVQSVSFEFLVPSYGGPRWEKVTFDTSNFEKWKQKSGAKFGGRPNANYTSWKGGIDPEFAGSKAIKHALKKRGTNKNESPMQMQNQMQQPIQARVYTIPEHEFTELKNETGETIPLEVVKAEEIKAEPIKRVGMPNASKL